MHQILETCWVSAVGKLTHLIHIHQVPPNWNTQFIQPVFLFPDIKIDQWTFVSLTWRYNGWRNVHCSGVLFNQLKMYAGVLGFLSSIKVTHKSNSSERAPTPSGTHFTSKEDKWTIFSRGTLRSWCFVATHVACGINKYVVESRYHADYGPLARYVKLRVAHALGNAGNSFTTTTG